MAKERKHPKGLMVLFFTEMWERFGFYLLLGIFWLYMTADETAQFPGMGFSKIKADDIIGTYLALVYLTPFFGGLIADRILGCRKSVIIGAILFAAGYFGLAIPGNNIIFFLSLLLIIIGNGFFKPNISTLVGKIYNKKEFLPNKDVGYNIFYMGINVGALVSNLFAAYFRIHYGWGWAFAIAGIGMVIGLIWFLTTQTSNIKEADVVTPPKSGDKSIGVILTNLFVPAFAVGALGWFLPTMIFGKPLLGLPSTDAFLFFCIPIVWYYISIYKKASKQEKAPIGALLSVFTAVIIFFAIFHQTFSALTNWIERYTNREIPESVEKTVTTLGLFQEVSTEPDTFVVTDNHFVPIPDANGNEQYKTQANPYFKNYKGELPPENKKLTLFTTELFQSINPAFIILLTPLLIGLFNILKRKNKEPSTPVKITIGMFITALSAIVMVLAVLSTSNGAVKGSAMWLVGTYGVITVGEIFLSPMGLSLVSKLSPPRFAALMMGGWFLFSAIGNKLSGILASLWDLYSNKAWFFVTNSLLGLIAVMMLVVLLPWLKRVVKEYGGE